MTDTSTPTSTSIDQQIDKRSFFVFGHDIAHSLSPTLHNAAFQYLDLPHHYAIHQSPSVDASVEEILTRPDLGGASVTFPHKLQIDRLLDAVTPRAEKIGPINNTQGSAALVLGAGGASRAACYAIQALGVSQLVVVNRTPSTAKTMKTQFSTRSHVFTNFEDALKKTTLPIRIIVACIPADDLTEEKIPVELFAADRGVLVEMAYRPQVTSMMKVAVRNKGWMICKGVDILEDQAYEQFELWTSQKAPTKVMREAT